MSQIGELKQLNHLRLVSQDERLFESIKKHNQVQIAAKAQLESLQVLILEVIINPPKLAIIKLAYPNLKQIYLDQSRIICLCQRIPQSRNLPKLQPTIDPANAFVTVPKETKESVSDNKDDLLSSRLAFFGENAIKHMSKPKDCDACLLQLAKVLDGFAHLPKITEFTKTHKKKLNFKPKNRSNFKKRYDSESEDDVVSDYEYYGD